MMTSRIHNEHTTQWLPYCGMPAAGVYGVSLSLSPSNIFGGTLGQRAPQSKDSRQIRH